MMRSQFLLISLLILAGAVDLAVLAVGVLGEEVQTNVSSTQSAKDFNEEHPCVD
jgi:hypothetical protein